MLRTILPLTALLAASPAWAMDSDGSLPDRSITHCVTRPATRADLCEHSTREVRNVPVTARVAAWRAYGLHGERDGWCAGHTRDGREGCEGDHLCPLAIGGANPPGRADFLWPQRPDGPHGYPVKDLCEARAHRAICGGEIEIDTAQAIFAQGDWRANCEAAFPDLKLLSGWGG